MGAPLTTKRRRREEDGWFFGIAASDLFRFVLFKSHAKWLQFLNRGIREIRGSMDRSAFFSRLRAFVVQRKLI
jgi:hypothetical protein